MVDRFIHEELEYLTRIGLTSEEVLNAATQLPARVFGLKDRGCIEIGKRADLLLVRGNPLNDIGVTKNIEKVWIKGVEVANAGYTERVKYE